MSYATTETIVFLPPNIKKVANKISPKQIIHYFILRFHWESKVSLYFSIRTKKKSNKKKNAALFSFPSSVSLCFVSNEKKISKYVTRAYKISCLTFMFVFLFLFSTQWKEEPKHWQRHTYYFECLYVPFLYSENTHSYYFFLSHFLIMSGAHIFDIISSQIIIDKNTSAGADMDSFLDSDANTWTCHKIYGLRLLLWTLCERCVVDCLWITVTNQYQRREKVAIFNFQNSLQLFQILLFWTIFDT